MPMRDEGSAPPTPTDELAGPSARAVEPPREPTAEPAEPTPERPRWDRRSWLWLGALVVVAAVLLLSGLGMGTMRPYDEGLYGKLARNALEHHQYLHAVGLDGELYEGFTKPPLTIDLVALSFHTQGVSLAALRLPFALAMIALVAVCFAWGHRIDGRPMAIAWAGVMLAAAASTRWGRVACIEPMLMLWIAAGLWAYHEALVRRAARSLAWAALAGLALALALATKQLVVAIAVLPIVTLELWRRDGRIALARVALALGIPAITGAIWFGAMLHRHGRTAIDLLLDTGVVRRVSGFETGHGARSLNELSEIVAEACSPFPWVLGVAGLTVLVVMHAPARRRADGALLLPLLLATAIAVYDNASQSLRPWYAFDLVVPLTAGLGFVIAGVASTSTDPRARLRAVAGALTLAVAAIEALETSVSQLDLALVGALAAALLLLPRPGRDPSVVRFGRAALMIAAAVALSVGALRRPERHETVGGHEQLMATFARRGITVVDVDHDTRIAGEHAWGTYYGPRARWVSRAPWRAHAPAPQAYVTATIWPTELVPNNGGELIRAPGVLAVVGNLDRPPWDHTTIRDLLDAGPVTFEAEHLPSHRDDALVDDPQASGGAARAFSPPAARPTKAFLLTYGPALRFPADAYVAQVWLRWRCGPQRDQPAAVVHVVSGNKGVARHEVACDQPGPDHYEPIEVEFDFPRGARLEVRVQYISGELWHDRTVVRRREQ